MELETIIRKSAERDCGDLKKVSPEIDFRYSESESKTEKHEHQGQSELQVQDVQS